MKQTSFRKLIWPVATLAFVWLAALADAADTNQPVKFSGDLEGLTLEQLVNVQVTSVSKKETDLFTSAAAIYVITQEDIRRSGMTNSDGRIKISMMDNGVGISPENLTRIFNYGFTTRKSGHGFGLHSGALAAKEMGGSLNVHSDGPGKGAIFTLELPMQPESGSSSGVKVDSAREP
jgi:signal transduction histidine kinase